MRLRLRVVGQVQGVGFRPWAARTARQLGLVGSVHNGSDGVWLEVQGLAAERFVERLAHAPAPIAARLVARDELPERDDEDFVIGASEDRGAPAATLPPDLATCERCLAEWSDAEDRRHGYALLSCTACGPRYSIAGAPPFDREHTAMGAFEHCPACRAEHVDPDDRRHHAQASACPDCGPRLSLTLQQAAAHIRAGEVLAVKGLSGFQLLCDAQDESAVQQLRRAKHRPDKPLAVMVADPGAVAGVTTAERAALEGPDAPIVLCDATLELAPSVLRGVRSVGLMRPSTAVHHGLAALVATPLVCTSANRSGKPLATETARAEVLADAVLDHDRPIWRGADDSVVRVLAGRRRVLRRARGHAPRPISLGRGGPPLLALGADLKSVVALAIDDQAMLSPHLGSQGSRSMLERLEEEVTSLCTVFDVVPTQLICDANPDLVTTRVAEQLATEWAIEVQRVHHHHAHIAAVCAEHGLERPVIGVAWDGVGLGPDGGTWGGEVLQVHGAACERVDHLRPLALPGGDACAREPGRVALALLHGSGLTVDATLHPRAEALWSWLERLAPSCTAAGRLFDGIAVLAGLPDTVTYEAQLPLQLEQAAALAGPAHPYPLAEAPLDWRPWVRGLLEDRQRGAGVGELAARFHETLVQALTASVLRHPEPDVVLSGGCFQNRLLVEGAVARLQAAGRRVWLARDVPPGDGGICLGQAWIARQRGA